MRFWIDAQLTPSLAPWLIQTFGVEAYAVRDLGLRDADDNNIFQAARDAAAIVITKDRDFVDLQNRHGIPPQLLWLTCGNTSNQRLRDIFTIHFPDALELLSAGEALVEITESALPASPT